MSSYARKALHGAAIVFTLSMFSALTAYFFRFLLARKLSVEDYGLFFALFAFINLLGLFKDLGLGFAILKFIPELRVAKKWDRIKSLIASSFIIQLVSSAAISIVLVILAPKIMQGFFHSPDTRLFLLFAAIFFVSFAQNVVSICFQGFQKMLLFSLHDFARNLVALLTAVALLALGFGIFAPAWAYFAMYIIVFVASFAIFTTKVFRQFWKARTVLASQDFSQLLLFGLPAMLTIFGNNVLQYTDTLMLTYFKDLTSAGLYQVAVPLASVVLFLVYAVSAVATPLISELVALKKRKELRNGIELLHKHLFIAVVPMAVALIAFPEIFIRLFFGEKFITAAPALQILGVGIVFYTIAYANLSTLFGLGRPEYTTMVMLVTAVANIALNWLMIPPYGMVGAASATGLSYLLMLVISARGIRRVVKIREPWIVWAKTLVAALLLVAVLAAVKGILALNPWLELALGILAGTAVYLLFLFVLRIITLHEIRWMAAQAGLRRTK
ncbi:MAG: flippase [Candidatus Woesearchaeota archaeon]